MSKRLIFAAAVSLSVAACSNPVSSTPDSHHRPAFDQTATPGGNMMGGGS